MQRHTPVLSIISGTPFILCLLLSGLLSGQSGLSLRAFGGYGFANTTVSSPADGRNDAPDTDPLLVGRYGLGVSVPLTPRLRLGVAFQLVEYGTSSTVDGTDLHGTEIFRKAGRLRRTDRAMELPVTLRYQWPARNLFQPFLAAGIALNRYHNSRVRLTTAEDVPEQVIFALPLEWKDTFREPTAKDFSAVWRVAAGNNLHVSDKVGLYAAVAYQRYLPPFAEVGIAKFRPRILDLEVGVRYFP